MARLLIKNGKVWDGENFIIADILTDNGTIALISQNITENADYVYDASEKIVSAGLIDIHTHMLGHYGTNADLSCIPFGVTSAAEASAAKNSREKYENYLVKNKVFISTEIKNNTFDCKKVISELEHYGDKAVGLKVYFDTTVSDVHDTTPLKAIVDFAQKNNLKVMVHSSYSPVPMVEIVRNLRKGDILTHSYHGGMNNALDYNFECLKFAKAKEVIIDTGFAGNVHADFKVFEEAVKSGCSPDTISTDITNLSAYKRGGRYGMTMCMSISKALNMTEQDIFRAVTTAPAKALGMEDEWGVIKVGRCADISVFDYHDEPFELTDKAGNTVSGQNGYRCVLTIADGRIVYRI